MIITMNFQGSDKAKYVKMFGLFLIVASSAIWICILSTAKNSSEKKSENVNILNLSIFSKDNSDLPNAVNDIKIIKSTNQPSNVQPVTIKAPVDAKISPVEQLFEESIL